jgi:glycosyltransferase involved in cell wall biosynthesis
MPRPVTYDLTHLAHRVRYLAPSGIEKVDLAFGQYFSQHPKKLCAAVHYGVTKPAILDPARVGSVVKEVRRRWRENVPVEEDIKYQQLRAWLLSKATRPKKAHTRESFVQKAAATYISSLRSAVLPYLQDRSRKIPEGAIYLNVAQHAFEIPRFFKWLSNRRDLQRVFFIHDLLPLDCPEFWPDGYKALFERRIACAATHATAFITGTKYVRDRLSAEMKKRGRTNVPIFTHALPPPNDILDGAAATDRELANACYFGAIGTIEPRKNHLLLLNIWRELAASDAHVPKLVIVGKRGWTNDQVIGAIELSTSLSPHVSQISGLANSSLKSLIAHAKAVLMPSFAEGFGLPVVEALSLGTPVVASNIPVFREVSGGHAIFCHPLDGMAWLHAIRELAKDHSPLAREARAAARSFVPVTSRGYFNQIEEFLASL